MESRITNLRATTGLSQTAFAEVLGVSVSSLRRWESGLASPSPLALARIKDISKEDINALLDQIREEKASVMGGLKDHSFTLHINGEKHKATYMPCVINGPKDQLSFHKKLISLQEQSAQQMSREQFIRRLSLVKSVGDTLTAQYELEKPKPTSKCWSSDYGTHGYHRYVGRFPSHLIRALINYFGAGNNDTILDPFCGSGTTLVEARMLGAPAIGIEISPLSAIISSVKSKYPESGIDPIKTIKELTGFYQQKCNAFCAGHDIEYYSYEDILNRNGNLIPVFANHEKWLTKEALLGTSIVLEYISSQKGYIRDFLIVALSAKMRSIGNVDVDVVRAEYRKTPRVGVDVLKLVSTQITKMARAGRDMLITHQGIVGSAESIKVLETNALQADITPGSIAHIITSPPYGVESLSYLRTHLLSFRVLESLIEVDPYNFNNGVIGSEYLLNETIEIKNFKVSSCSNTYSDFFNPLLKKCTTENDRRRVVMMMKFFEDMHEMISKFYLWMKPGGKVAFVIGNKKIGDDLIPTDVIIREIFESCGFAFEQSIAHKLKTNNSNSQVPWQERIIENEFILIFTKGIKSV